MLAVLLYHDDLSWIQGGFLGVEVFFVISGYLITAILLGKYRNANTIDLKSFWLGRARRLLPALYLMLGVVAAWWLLFYPGLVGKLKGQFLSGSLYFSNWYLAFAKVSYFSHIGRPSPLIHLWSLAVEEQFYLVWPLILFGLLRLFKGRPLPLLVSILGAALLSTVIMAALYHTGHDPSVVYYGTETRASGLLVGAALAVVWRPWLARRRPNRRRGVLADTAGLAALGLLRHLLPRRHRAGRLLVPRRIPARRPHDRPAHRRLRDQVQSRAEGQARFEASRVDRAALVRHLSVALADLRRPPAGGPPRSPPLRPAPRRHHGGGRRLLPVRGDAISQRPRPGLAGPVARPRESSGNGPFSFERSAGAAALVCVVALLVGGVVTHNPGKTQLQVELEQAAKDPANRAGVASDGLRSVGPTASHIAEPPASVKPAASTPAPTTTAPPAVASTTTPTTTAVAATTPTTVAAPSGLGPLAIGDSVMLGAANALRAAIPGIRIDAAIGRQWNAGVALVQANRAAGQLGNTVIIGLGNNGTVTPAGFNAMMAALAGVPNVIVIDVRVDRSWQNSDNAVLRAGAAGYPSIHLVDWYGYSAGHSNWFYDDGTHLRPDTAANYAALVAQGLKPAG